MAAGCGRAVFSAVDGVALRDAEIWGAKPLFRGAPTTTTYKP